MTGCRQPGDSCRCTKRAEDYGPLRGRGVVGSDATGAVAAANDLPAPYADGRPTDGVKREARSLMLRASFFCQAAGGLLYLGRPSLKRQYTARKSNKLDFLAL